MHIDILVTRTFSSGGNKTNYKSSQRGPLAGCNDYPAIYGDDKPFDPAFLLRFDKDTRGLEEDSPVLVSLEVK